jgi:glycosyltransferase involved in cell wall biosynthesis
MTGLSLLIPCYNAEKYISIFLEHLKELSVDFDEIIFYDDYSSDNTVKLLHDSGHKVIRGNVNEGPGFARNRLAEEAKYDYIHFHDIDDKFNPEFLPIVSRLLEQSDSDVIVGSAHWIDSKTEEIIIKWEYDQASIEKDSIGYFLSNPLGIINTIYKKTLFAKSGGFDEQLRCWEDADLHVKLAISGAKFSVTKEVLAYSLRHNNGISQDQNWCNECRLEFLKKYLNQLPPHYESVILSQLGKCALQFYYAASIKKLEECITIGRKYGYTLPDTNNPILKFLKKSPLPSKVIYDLQKLSVFISKKIAQVFKT